VVTFTIGGRGKKGGIAGTMLLLTVTININGEPVEANKNDFEVFYQVPPGVEIKPSLMTGKNGIFHVGFNPKEPGQYWVDFVYKGKWATEPFLVPVNSSTGLIPEFPYDPKKRKSITQIPTTDTQKPPNTTPLPEKKPELSSPPISPKDTDKTLLKEKEKPPVVPVSTTIQKDSSDKPKEIKEKVPPTTTQLKETTDKPKEIKERTPVAPHLSSAQGNGLETLTDMNMGVFTVTIRDMDNIPISDYEHLEVSINLSGNKKSHPITIINNKDGTYRCSYEPLSEGKYQIVVKVQGKHIKGSPWNVVVTEGVSNGEFSALSVYIQVINKKGDIVVVRNPAELSIFNLDCKGGTGSFIQDSSLEEGRYHFEYKGVSGVNTLNVISTATGKSIDGFPFTISV
jgi:hypothetical protein